jgi:DNA mismatch repair protein MutS
MAAHILLRNQPGILMTEHASTPKLTPMFEQYLAIKADYPDSLLFYRMGDFYELFFADAEVAARELQITLTSRNPSSENPVPMCGVPHHSAESYLKQLLDKGYKVAICEQVEDPRTAKNLVKREVIMVRTPGTAVEETSLAAKAHNYLGAVYWDKPKNRGGFAWLEYSTGEWSGLFSKKEAELWQWVQKMRPRELLVPDLPPDEFRLPQGIFPGDTTPVRLPTRVYFDHKAAAERILEGGFSAGDLMLVTARDGKLVIEKAKKQQPALEPAPAAAGLLEGV